MDDSNFSACVSPPQPLKNGPEKLVRNPRCFSECHALLQGVLPLHWVRQAPVEAMTALPVLETSDIASTLLGIAAPLTPCAQGQSSAAGLPGLTSLPAHTIVSLS